MRQVLQPYILREESEHHFALVEYGDGSADVYIGGDGMMANHISGDQPWDLPVAGARAADWVIMPVGCPTSITAEAQRGTCRTASMRTWFSCRQEPSCFAQFALPSCDAQTCWEDLLVNGRRWRRWSQM